MSKSEDNLSKPSARTTTEVSSSVKAHEDRERSFKTAMKRLKHNSNANSTLTQEGASPKRAYRGNTTQIDCAEARHTGERASRPHHTVTSNNTKHHMPYADRTDDLKRSHVPLFRNNTDGKLSNASQWVSFSTPGDKPSTAVRQGFLRATRLNKKTPKMTVDHFREAQRDEWSGFDSALEEIQQGCKRGCWMWYIFPQIAGLGKSPISQTYSISNRAHAVMYLHDEELCGNLLEMTRAVANQIRSGISIKELVHWDHAKLISSLTLFEIVADELAAKNESLEELASLCHAILEMASEDGFSRCKHTLEVLSDDGLLEPSPPPPRHTEE